MRTADEILISLLAATDAAWLPCRESHGIKLNPAVTNAYEARKRFHEAGVPWSSGGTSDAERKEIQRALDDLKESGDVIAAKPNGTKTLFARLADDVYNRTRRKCGLTSAVTAFAMLKLDSVHSVRPSTFYQHVWIPETTFSGERGWGGYLAKRLSARDFWHMRKRDPFPETTSFMCWQNSQRLGTIHCPLGFSDPAIVAYRINSFDGSCGFSNLRACSTPVIGNEARSSKPICARTEA